MLSYIQRTSGTVSPQANQVELAFANLINEVFYDKKKMKAVYLIAALLLGVLAIDAAIRKELSLGAALLRLLS